MLNTLGITALYFLIDHIDKKVCDLDVGLGYFFNEDIKKRSLFNF